MRTPVKAGNIVLEAVLYKFCMEFRNLEPSPMLNQTCNLGHAG